MSGYARSGIRTILTNVRLPGAILITLTDGRDAMRPRTRVKGHEAVARSVAPVRASMAEL